MCLYPRLIENKKYRANQKNGGNIPPVLDKRVVYVPVGCQQCIECRKQKALQWKVRLLEDIKTNTNGKFITLTLSNESLKQLNKDIPTNITGYDRDNAIATLSVRRMLERWRKTYKKSLRHWLVTELGHKGTENIHMHGIIWTNEPLTQLEKHWQYGFIWKGYKRYGQIINYVNGQTTSYISKYINKVDFIHKTYKSKILTSPGIGENYTKTYNSKLNAYKENKTNELYRTATGHTLALPIYWRNKIYTDAEREKLWLQKLDKEERYVCGEKVDISKTEEIYYKLLEYHRKREQELGYIDQTDQKKLWKRKKYEEERRKLLHEARIKNAFGGK